LASVKAFDCPVGSGSDPPFSSFNATNGVSLSFECFPLVSHPFALQEQLPEQLVFLLERCRQETDIIGSDVMFVQTNFLEENTLSSSIRLLHRSCRHNE